jgi:hypothetical protein
MGRSTLQGTHTYSGDLSAGQAIDGLGIGIYTSDGGTIELVTKGGSTATYQLVPAGTQLQVPLFKEITSNTTSTDIVATYIKPPYC